MSENAERRIIGPLTARELAGGAWILSGDKAGGIDILISGGGAEARATLSGICASEATVAWQRSGALVTLATAGGRRRIRARTVILHEPKALLYDGLPLMRLDDAARRFWRRVFWLVRVPGGRRLLGLVARRSPRSK